MLELSESVLSEGAHAAKVAQKDRVRIFRAVGASFIAFFTTLSKNTDTNLLVFIGISELPGTVYSENSAQIRMEQRKKAREICML